MVWCNRCKQDTAFETDINNELQALACSMTSKKMVGLMYVTKRKKRNKTTFD